MWSSFFNSFDAQHVQQKGIFCILPEFKPQYRQTGLKFTIDSVTLTGNFTKMFCPSIHPYFLEATEKGSNKTCNVFLWLLQHELKSDVVRFPPAFSPVLQVPFCDGGAWQLSSPSRVKQDSLTARKLKEVGNALPKTWSAAEETSSLRCMKSLVSAGERWSTTGNEGRKHLHSVQEPRR